MNKQYYNEHREELSAKHKEYYRKNQERLLAQKKKHYEENREKILQSQKEYVAKNHEQVLASKKAYYQTNQETVKAKVKAYRVANREKFLAYKRAYNAAHATERNEKQKTYYKEHRDEKRAYDNAYYVKKGDTVRKAVNEYKKKTVAELNDALRKIYSPMVCCICGRIEKKAKLGVIFHEKNGKKHTYYPIPRLEYYLAHPADFVLLCNHHHITTTRMMYDGFKWEEIQPILRKKWLEMQKPTNMPTFAEIQKENRTLAVTSRTTFAISDNCLAVQPNFEPIDGLVLKQVGGDIVYVDPKKKR